MSSTGGPAGARRESAGARPFAAELQFLLIAIAIVLVMLLAGVPGLRLKEMDECEQCCGFGGTFAVKFGEVSAAIADRKCAQIRASGADAVVAGDLGCLLNIEGRLRRLGDRETKVLHVAEVLAGEAP